MYRFYHGPLVVNGGFLFCYITHVQKMEQNLRNVLWNNLFCMFLFEIVMEIRLCTIYVLSFLGVAGCDRDGIIKTVLKFKIWFELMKNPVLITF